MSTCGFQLEAFPNSSSDRALTLRRDIHLRLLLLAITISANSCAEIPLKHTLLQIDGAPPDTSLGIASPEEHALAPFPALNAEEEEERGNEDHDPLPADSLVSEDRVVDDRNVQDREDGDETKHDREEQELVAPDICRPLSEVLLGAGLHHKE